MRFLSVNLCAGLALIAILASLPSTAQATAQCSYDAALAACRAERGSFAYTCVPFYNATHNETARKLGECETKLNASLTPPMVDGCAPFCARREVLTPFDAAWWTQQKTECMNGWNTFTGSNAPTIAEEVKCKFAPHTEFYYLRSEQTLTSQQSWKKLIRGKFQRSPVECNVDYNQDGERCSEDGEYERPGVCKSLGHVGSKHNLWCETTLTAAQALTVPVLAIANTSEEAVRMFKEKWPGKTWKDANPCKPVVKDCIEQYLGESGFSDYKACVVRVGETMTSMSPNLDQRVAEYGRVVSEYGDVSYSRPCTG